MQMQTLSLALALLSLSRSAPGQDRIDPAVEKFRQRLMQSGDREPLRLEVCDFVRRKVGTPASTQAGEVLKKLPSPLDTLNKDTIPELDRFKWQPDELVAVLGEHRGRHGSHVTRVLWTPDGKRILSGGGNGYVRSWDPVTLRQQWRVASGAASCMAVSNDSKVLAVGSGGTVYVWDISKDVPVQTGAFTISTSGVYDVHISPDRKHLAAGVYDGLIHLWHLDGAKPKVRTQLSGHQAAVTAVRFSPQGTLTTVSIDGFMRFWNVSKEAIPDPLKVEVSKNISHMDYSPSGETLAVSVNDTIELYRPQTRNKKPIPKAHAGGITYLSYSRRGYLVTSSSDGTVKAWNPPAARPYTVIEGHFGGVAGAAWSPDERQVATGGSDWTVRLWSVGGMKGVERHQLRGHWMGVSSTPFSPDCTDLATGGQDRTARIWDLTKPAPRQDVQSPPLASLYKNDAYSIAVLAYSPDGNGLAIGGSGPNVRLWDVKKRNIARTFVSPAGHTNQLLYTPDGYTLVGGYGASVFAWASASARELHKFSTGDRYVNVVRFSPDARLALSGSGYYLLDAKNQIVMKDGKYVYQEIALKSYDLKTGKEWKERKDLPLPVAAASFRPDGQPYVSLWNSPPRLWEATRETLKEGRELTDLVHPHKGHPYVFSPDGKTYLAGANPLSLVEVETGKILKQWNLEEQVYTYAFAPDARHINVALVTGPVYILRLEKPPELTSGK